MLCGAGTAGAYQAGVLRALAEAGIKVDVLAAHGPGAMTALCGAIDGGARLWDPAGPWLSPRLHSAYRWRAALRTSAIALAVAGLLVLSPIAVLGFAAVIYALSFLAGLVNLPNISLWLVQLYQRSVGLLFDPPILPTMLPRFVVLALCVVVGVLAAAAVQAVRQDRTRRRWRGAFWWRLIGMPLQSDEPDTTLVQTLWELVRGASTEPQPSANEIGRRYIEMLTENMGQPGFRELIVGVHDLDGRRDLVGAVLSPEVRQAFAARRSAVPPAASGTGPREAESVDFTGSACELVVDFLRGALRLPGVMPPHVCTFPGDSYWRGESHRLCDRPELVVRLIEEVAIAGVEQLVFVSPAPPAALPHGMRSTSVDLRARTGDLLRSIETAALQDAWSLARTRFSGVFVVRPDHNPIGPFQFAGAYDEASDRMRPASELLAQGYQDAYRQFIEPIVAAGDKIEG